MKEILSALLNFIMNLFAKSNSFTPRLNTDESNEISGTLREQKEEKMVSADIPEKQAGSLNGSDFIQTIINIGPTQQREDLIFAEFQKGNVPDFMRNFVEISLSVGSDSILYYVTSDVLCVGTDDDFIRTPLNPITAQKIADLYGCVLPTPKMATQIWKAATVKLNPDPNGAPYDNTQQSTEKFVFHNGKIEKQRAGRAGLINGHKKDVVICKHLLSDHSKVAIFGWFYSNGSPIQQLNPKDHSKEYKDYSHGIRLIAKTCVINDEFKDVYDVLKDPSLCHLLSDEGSFDATNIYK